MTTVLQGSSRSSSSPQQIKFICATLRLSISVHYATTGESLTSGDFTLPIPLTVELDDQAEGDYFPLIDVGAAIWTELISLSPELSYIQGTSLLHSVTAVLSQFLESISDFSLEGDLQQKDMFNLTMIANLIEFDMSGTSTLSAEHRVSVSTVIDDEDLISEDHREFQFHIPETGSVWYTSFNVDQEAHLPNKVADAQAIKNLETIDAVDLFDDGCGSCFICSEKLGIGDHTDQDCIFKWLMDSYVCPLFMPATSSKQENVPAL